jgi:uncharacterized protein YndB with AHSA1/START domain
LDKPKFVYVTYIATTPDKLWEALVSPEFTALYWGGTRLESDWKVGSPVNLVMHGEGTDKGEVLHFEPFKKIAYTFNVGWDAEMAAEGASRVTYELEEMNRKVKLTVIHDQFEPGSKVLAAVSNGWPGIMSSLKSFLETGEALYEKKCD